MSNFNNARLSDFYRNKYLGPLTSAMGNMGYDVQVMCLPKSSSSDLPILTEGNVTIARAKVIIICRIFYSYNINSLYHRMLLLALVTRILLLGTSHFPKVTMLSGNLILTPQPHKYLSLLSSETYSRTRTR